ncbi:hypothetical protein [Leptolyngbya ohadii]|uniref:hypothetical protein n=1 Tax=Leptolyngbya ohadii TaxID=1962290 RepID=UPI000B59A278|nr:hypothetical protein [Leptolyngbya ohadii]
MSSDAAPRVLRISIATALTIATTAAVIPGAVGCLITTDTYLRQQSKQEFEQEQQAIANTAFALATAGDYHGCVAQAAQVLPQAKVYQTAQVYLRNCQTNLVAPQLAQARQQAAQGQFAQAIETVNQIAVGSAQYDEAKQLIEQWSERILEIAWSDYWQPVNQFGQAIAIASAIPPSSPAYPKAQAQIQAWRQLWTENNQHWVAAQQALNLEQFAVALTQAQQIQDHPFWTHNRISLIQIVEEQRLQQQYEDIWNQAERLLAQGEPENAIATAAQLPDTLPWRERKQQVIDRAEAKRRQVSLCQTLSLGLLGCY